MSREIIKKLAGIFEKQQLVLQKLAYPPISLHEARQLFGLPADFDYATAKEAINRYVAENSNKPDWNAKIVTFNRALVVLEQDFERRKRSKKIDQPQIDALPPDFDDAVNHYLTKRKEAEKSHFARQDFEQTMRQLHGLARGHKPTWDEFGEYFPNWTPAHVHELLKKLSG